MAKDDVERVVARLKRAGKGLQEYKDKIWRLRTIVAGDPRGIVNRGDSADQSETDVKRAYTPEWSDIFVKDIEEGRSNEMLRTIRTLVQQTTHQFPEIEAEDLAFEEANLHAEYFRQRLGPSPLGCDAVTHMRRALYDYLIGGFGWVWIGMQAGKPVLRYVDTIDCKWDQAAPTVSSGTWWSTTMYASLETWERMYGRDKFDTYIREKNAEPDTPVELEYYYDLSGSEGVWMVLFKTGSDDIDHKPVFKSKNPCFWEYAGQRVPFLPAEAMFFMELPSVRLPIGLAEQMLPSQTALWGAEKSIRETANCPAGYTYEEGSYDATELQKFEHARTGSFIQHKAGKQPMQQYPALQIPESLMAWHALHKQNITGQGGADPYASGAPVEGTTYAAEVNAIRGAASLMAGTISKENTAFWIRTLRKFLAKGAAFDEWPLIVRHEDVNIVFDESDPIKGYLKPDTKLTIREESMQFMDEQTRLLMATKDVEMAGMVAAQFPNALKEAYENYLRERGEKNVDKYLEQPAAPGMAPGAPPGQTPVAAVTGAV